MNDNSKVLLALLAGIAAGVAIGVLIAPEKGTDLRQRIADTLGDIGEDVKAKLLAEYDKLTKVSEEEENNIAETIPKE